MSELLKLKGISKEFPGVKALQNVDLELNRGEVLALLGENGAGKSTLLKIISGVYLPDAGEIYVDGEKKNFKIPADAAAEGIGIIYQELSYYDELTVAENIFVGKLPKANRIKVDWKEMNRRAKEILARLNVQIDPRALVKTLSTAEKQLVEIAKALASDTKILIMDEPTSALNDAEVKSLIEQTRKLAGEGIGVIFISHRLEELFAVADRIQIMRDGKRIDAFSMKDATPEKLVQLMVGREIKDMYPKGEIKKGDVVLEVKHLKNKTLKDISFSVRAGEILGVFGLMGAGRTEMCKAIFGASKLQEGEILMHGKPVKIHSVEDAKKAKIAYLPNDRKKEGLILSQSVKENFASAVIDRYTKGKGFIVDKKRVDRNADKWIKKLNVSTPSGDTVVETLSGGNQQKVVVGKWLETSPDVIILNEPTRGIDVGAKVEIYKLIEELCQEGMAVVMVSSEQAEVLSLTDRAIVLCEGRLTGELCCDDYTQERLMEYAIGGGA